MGAPSQFCGPITLSAAWSFRRDRRSSSSITSRRALRSDLRWPAWLRCCCWRGPDTTCGNARLNLRRRQFFFEIHQLLELYQEPAVNFRELKNLLHRQTGAQGMADEENSLGIRRAEFGSNQFAWQDGAVAIDFVAETPGLAVTPKAITADFQRTQG